MGGGLMGRIRTIKPEFWAHEVLSELPEPTHMLAAALLNYADDEGYFNANPALVKAACSPIREPSVSIQCSLNQLSKAGYLEFGKSPDGRTYGRIVKFSAHQNVNRASVSKIKTLEIDWVESLKPQCGLSESSSLEQGTGNREEKEMSADADLLTPAKPTTKPAARFSEFWSIYPRIEGKKAALQAWQAKRLDQIADVIIQDVARRKVEHGQWLDGIYPHAATYLRNERWTDAITPPRGRPNGRVDSGPPIPSKEL